MRQGRLMSGASRWVAVAMLGFLTGCMPFPHGGYYRPSLENGAAERLHRSCGGQVGPEEVLRIPVEGVEMRVRFQDKDGALDGHIALTVAAGTKFRFLGDEFLVTDLENGKTVRAVHDGLGSYDPTRHQSVHEPLEAVVIGRNGRSIDLSAPSMAPWRFRFVMPPFEIDGQRRMLAQVEVEYRLLDIGLYPFNC